MPDDGIICLDNGVYKIWFARGYTACKPNTVLLDNALATMGAGLPSAMMSAMLYPISWLFIMKPPSPQIAMTLRPGYTIADIIALGSPAPIVASALSSSTVFGR